MVIHLRILRFARNDELSADDFALQNVSMPTASVGKLNIKIQFIISKVPSKYHHPLNLVK